MSEGQYVSVGTAKELAREVERCGHELNQAIRKAAEAGVQVALDVQEHNYVRTNFATPNILLRCAVDPKLLDSV